MAKYYGVTVDSLMNEDLTNVRKLNFDLSNSSSIKKYLEEMYPLFKTEELMENANFKNGYNYCLEMINSVILEKTIRGTIMADAITSFCKAVDEEEACETQANLLWCFFNYWSQLYSTEKKIEMSKCLSNSTTDLIKLRKLTHELTPEEITNRNEYLDQYEGFINAILQELKSNEEWSDLGDYYLALKYILNMVSSDHGIEMNSSIRIELMYSFAMLENKYALNYFRLINMMNK